MSNSPSSSEVNTAGLEETLKRMSIQPAEVPLPPTPAPTLTTKPTQITPAPSPSPRKSRTTNNTPSRAQSFAAEARHTPRSPQVGRKPPREISQTPTKHIDSTSTTTRSSPATSLSSATDASSVHDVVPLTASAIAAQYFKQELESHQYDSTSQSSDTVVIIHDACYGHRFSRPRTSKSTLSLIVERPERVQAVIRGISSAYVRLGSRHGSELMKGVEDVSASSIVPFKIKRSSRVVPITSSVVTNVHGVKWMEELKTLCESAGTRLASGQKELARMEDPNDPTPKAHLHEGDLYLCQESLDAFQGALGGVLDAVDQVFEPAETSPAKKAFVCVRPPGHHCSADLPSGFCWLNNVHVGIEHAAQAHGLTHAAIIDFDLHHGDGSQAITWERNAKAWKMPKSASILKKTATGYFSIHDINSYPCEDGNVEKVQAASLCIENAHGQTVWNTHLQSWKSEAEFWDLYRSRYVVLLDKARAFLRAQTQRVRTSAGNVQPRAAIFISAGFDASEYEGEGMQRHKVNVPTEFYARFTSDIVQLAQEEGLSTDGRVISVLEGGYSDRALASGALGHLVGLVGVPSTINRAEAHSRRSSVGGFDTVFPTSWWNTLAMTELEALVSKSQGQFMKSRPSDVITHASPTESFLAKVVDPAKLWKGPPPPPPIVDWATAAFELSKLLIPSSRQVNSHRAEELSEPRVKKERAVMAMTPSSEQTGDRMQLRGRKPKEAPQPSTTAALPIRNARTARKSTEGTTTPRTSLPSADGDLDLSKDMVIKVPSTDKIKSPTAPRAQHTPLTKGSKSTDIASDIDQLTASVKKITLKLSDKDKRELQATTEGKPQAKAGMAAKRQPVSRSARPAAQSKPTTASAAPQVNSPSPATKDVRTEPRSATATDMFTPETSPPLAQSQSSLDVERTHPVFAEAKLDVAGAGSVAKVTSETDLVIALSEGTKPLIAREASSDDGEVPPEHDGDLLIAAQGIAPEVKGLNTASALSSPGVFDTLTVEDRLSLARAVGENAMNDQTDVKSESQEQLPKAGSKDKLPVFSAHGHIPFGANALPSPIPERIEQEGGKDQRKVEDIWAVPDTPMK